MAEPDRRLLEAAEAVADGTPVAWDAMETQREGARDSMKGMRVVEGVARAHRVLHRTQGSTETGNAGTWGPLALRERLGEGAFGEVYRAYDPVLQRDVALKLRKPRPDDSPSTADQLLDEARRLARIRHPGVITIHGAESHDGRLGIWMDLLHGKTLEEVLRDGGPMNEREAAAVGIELCGALAAVHTAGLVHRDVKTTNVMRERGGRIVLMDFGSGRDFAPGADPIVTQHLHGTPIAMAPEQFRGEVVGPQTDIYGLGVLLYRLLTGRYPIEAASLVELAEKHRTGGAVPLRERRPDLSHGLVQVVERSMSPEPAGRFKSAAEMERALAPVFSVGLAVPSDDTGPHRKRPWRGILAAGGASAAVLAVVLILRTPAGDSPKKPPLLSELKREEGTSDVGPQPPETSPRRPPQSSNLSQTNTPTTLAPQPATTARIAASATLYRWRDGREERLLPGDRIAPGEKLAMVVEGTRQMYLYVLNEDEQGVLTVLYPLPGLEPQNPLAPGEEHRLPGRLAGRVIDWQVSSAGGAETILAIASSNPLLLLERDIASLPRASQGKPVAEIQLNQATVHSLRSIGGLIESDASDGSVKGTKLSDAVKSIQGKSTRSDEPWIWQIRLSNPAH